MLRIAKESRIVKSRPDLNRFCRTDPDFRCTSCPSLSWGLRMAAHLSRTNVACSNMGPMGLILRTIMAGAVVLLLCEIAAGQGGPPMITDDTGTVEKGHFEINTAFTMEVGRDGRLWGTPLIDFNYGTTRNTQLKIEIP